jgi:hypothetical protein
MSLAFLRPLLGILTFGLTIPVWLVLAVGLWVHFDKSSAVRQAVDRAVTELVTGAELEAERAKVQALEQINAELRGRAAALDAANTRFSESLLAAQTDLEDANAQIADLLSRPVNNACAVDSSILERLHSK